MADIESQKLVVIASSTGGPKALHQLIPLIDKRLDAPVVIVQHMPKGFTESLAERLDHSSEIAVSEVVDGEILQKGHVYLARGGKHLEIIEKKTGCLAFRENMDEPVNGLRPCANITYKSLTSLSIENIMCVVLTGMGADGTEGIRELKKKKQVYTVVQNQETCVIYGMPKSIVENGLADKILPLEDIGKEIIKKVGLF